MPALRSLLNVLAATAAILVAGSCARREASSDGPLAQQASVSAGHRSPPAAPEIPAQLKRGSDFNVTADQQQVSLTGGSLPAQSISWSDVRRISIITTGDGPQLTDVFVNLEGNRARLLVPQDSRDNEAFIQLLLKVAGFDLKNFAKAMGSAEPAEFQCWTGSSVTFRP